MHSSTAAGALCKKGYSEVELAGHQDPTRDLENKEQETEMTLPILHGTTRLSVWGFLHSRAFGKGSSHFM